MKVVGVKSVIRGKDGRVVGYSLKIGKELDEEIVERLARGEKLAKVVYDPFDPYLEHLRKNGILHKVFEINGTRAVMVKIDENFKRFDGLAGLGEIFLKLDGEDLNLAIETFVEAYEVEMKHGKQGVIADEDLQEAKEQDIAFQHLKKAVELVGINKVELWLQKFKQDS